MPINRATAEALITRYCKTWNEPDPKLRHQLLRTVLAEDGVYIDPTVHVVGVSALVDHISKVATKYPGSMIVRTSAVDLHHDVLRFSWHKQLANGQTLPESIDVCTINEDGKLRLIIGFFGPLISNSAAA
jgi:hypothetical protein